MYLSHGHFIIQGLRQGIVELVLIEVSLLLMLCIGINCF